MGKVERVVALVVTYNRKDLLVECIQALEQQDTDLVNIVVIDNNSTDGTNLLFENTGELIYDNLIYRRLRKNIGGAGGFFEGFKYINENLDYDWLWLMDDDTISEKNTLRYLLNDLDNLKGEKVSFIGSSVYGPNGESMNVPSIDGKKEENGYPFWYKYLDKGLVQINHATFVSLLISEKAIKKVGYPVKDYFIWGDDTEYTLRLTSRFGPAYFSGNSKIVHKRFNAKALSIKNEENSNRVKMYNYFYRNNLLNFKEYFSKQYFLKRFIGYFLYSISLLFNFHVNFRFKKFLAIQKGWWSFSLGLYNRKQFKSRIPEK